MRVLLTICFVLGATAPAIAWDGGALWYAPATADSPGGGGILGTGGGHDYGIKCSDCHVDRVMTNLAFALEFSPALPMVSGQQTYAPGQLYTVTGRMTNANLGKTCGDPYGMNTDNFAASFENDDGEAVGMLADDTGATAANCPAVPKMPMDPGTTGIAGDCEVVFSKGNEDLSTWTFYWTAPASGAVNIFWGAVDGDCLMKSMDDAVVEGKLVLDAPPMSRAPTNPHWPATFATLLVGLVFLPRRRRNKTAMTTSCIRQERP